MDENWDSLDYFDNYQEEDSGTNTANTHLDELDEGFGEEVTSEETTKEQPVGGIVPVEENETSSDTGTTEDANDKADTEELTELNTNYFQDYINNSLKEEEAAKIEEGAQAKVDELSQVMMANAASGNQLAYTGEDLRNATQASINNLNAKNEARLAGDTAKVEVLSRLEPVLDRREQEIAKDIRENGYTPVSGVSASEWESIKTAEDPYAAYNNIGLDRTGLVPSQVEEMVQDRGNTETEVKNLMEDEGMTFDEAFQTVTGHRPSEEGLTFKEAYNELHPDKADVLNNLDSIAYQTGVPVPGTQRTDTASIVRDAGGRTEIETPRSSTSSRSATPTPASPSRSSTPEPSTSETVTSSIPEPTRSETVTETSETPTSVETVSTEEAPTPRSETEVAPTEESVRDAMRGEGWIPYENDTYIRQNDDGGITILSPTGDTLRVAADGNHYAYDSEGNPYPDGSEVDMTQFYGPDFSVPTVRIGKDTIKDEEDVNTGSEEDMQELSDSMSTKTGYDKTVDRLIGKDTKLGQYLISQYDSGDATSILTGELITGALDIAFGNQVANFINNAGDMKSSLAQSKTGVQQMTDAIANKDGKGFWSSLGSFLKGLGNVLVGAGRTVLNGAQMVGNVVVGLLHLLSNLTGVGALVNVISAGISRGKDFLSSIETGLGVDENTAKQIADSIGFEEEGSTSESKSAAVTKKVGWSNKNNSSTDVSDYNKGLGETENNITSDFHKKVIKYLPHTRLAVRKWSA